jgi:hypothetical protein
MSLQCPQLMAILTRRPWDAWQRILEFLNTQARTRSRRDPR